MNYQIWYMKPSWFRDGMVGKKPDVANLNATHVHLKDLDIEEFKNFADENLDHIYHQMQGEIWSPNGEACELIRSKGLRHTSMSVGDVIVDPRGKVHVVASFGFEALN